MSGLVSSECKAALIVASLGPSAGCEGRGGVTRYRVHIALRANCSPAAAGLHEMAGHSDTQCKTEIRRDLSDFYDTSVLFSQLFSSRKLRPLCRYFHLHSFRYEAFISSTLPSGREQITLFNIYGHSTNIYSFQIAVLIKVQN